MGTLGVGVLCVLRVRTVRQPEQIAAVYVSWASPLPALCSVRAALQLPSGRRATRADVGTEMT